MNKDNHIKIDCRNCSHPTNHDIVVSTKENIDSGDFSAWYIITYYKGCDEFSFCQDLLCSEDEIQDEEGNSRPRLNRTIYPHRAKGVKLMKEYKFLPANIKNIYEETYTCISMGQNILAGIGIRAIIESVCKDQKCQGRNLEVKIEKLVALEFITSKNAQILHKLRFLGNKAAHDIRIYDDKSLITSFYITEHLIKEIYIIPKMASNIDG